MTLDEELNGPTRPTQQEIDNAFIQRMMLVICECHHWFNNQPPYGGIWKSPITMVQVIEAVKGDPEWRRHFRHMKTEPILGGEPDSRIFGVAGKVT
jgi:hypothetical protein